jgi:patatin-like phospholipase/acyl hydrolase
MKTFRILSIDGGGLRGLYAAKVLEQLEKKIGPLAKNFDLICGTSTGGLIALGVGLGRSCEEISDFYITRGQKIFPRKGSLRRNLGLARQLFANGYSSKALRREVEGFFGADKRMKDCQVPICIFSYNVSRGMPIVFKSPHYQANYTRDGEIPVLDVALATASAPTYFRNHRIDNEKLVDTYCTDGGVWINNPALGGLLEAWDHFVGKGKPYDTVQILSVSTAPKPSGKQGKGGGLLTWKGDLIGAAIKGQSDFTHHFLTKLQSGNIADVDYQRIEPQSLSSSEQKLLEMDLATGAALQQLSRLGTQDGINFITQQDAWVNSLTPLTV